MLSLAVVGAGQIGRAHAARIAASSECRLAAIADPAPTARVLARRLGVPWFAGVNSLLAAIRTDGVVLATPNSQHAPGALACLAEGVPVLIEKPLSDNLIDAQHQVEVQHRCGVPVLVGHHRRHSAVMARAEQIIASGQLGRLVGVNGSATFAKPDHYFGEGPWRAQPGGGPILINLVHEVDNLRALMGEIVAVQALASSTVRGLAVEDTVAINFQFCSGALGSFLLSDCAASPRSWEHTSGENPDFEHHAEQDCYVIAGTQGSLQVPTMQLLRYEGESSWYLPMQREQLLLPRSDPLQVQLAHFCSVLRGEAQPLVNAHDALRTLTATMAVAEAAATGHRVALA